MRVATFHPQRRRAAPRKPAPTGRVTCMLQEMEHETNSHRPIRRRGIDPDRRRVRTRPMAGAGYGSRGPGRRRRRHRAVHHRHPRRRAGRPEGAARPRPHARRAGRGWVGSRDEPGLPEPARGVLARRVRLAGAGAPAQPARAVQDPHRRARHPLRASPVGRARRVPADPDPRLAGHLRGVRQGHRAPDRPRRPRRAGRGRLPRRGPVHPRLRLLGPAAAARLRPRPHRRDLRRAHGAPGLRALRRPGRRPRRRHQPVAGRQRLGARGRTAPQPVHRRAARPRQSDRRRARGRGRADGGARRVLDRRGARLQPHARHQAADTRLQPQRLAGGARRVDRREVPELVRLRRQPRDALQQGRAADDPHHLLGHGDRDLRRPLLLRGPARRQRARPAAHRGADGLRGVSRRVPLHAPPLARGPLQPRPLHDDAERRPLRGQRGAGAVRRRPAGVLPGSAVGVRAVERRGLLEAWLGAKRSRRRRWAGQDPGLSALTFSTRIRTDRRWSIPLCVVHAAGPRCRGCCNPHRAPPPR